MESVTEEKTETLYARCRTTFLFLHNMGEYLLKAIKAKYLADGLVPRVHGHTGHIPHNSLVHKDLECIISFVIQFCETNAILMPGWIPGYKRRYPDTSATTKRSAWRTYRDTCTSLSEWAVACSTFCKVWRHFLPHVVARPLKDLCWRGQKKSNAIVSSANVSETEKSEVSILSIQHNWIVTCLFSHHSKGMLVAPNAPLYIQYAT